MGLLLLAVISMTGCSSMSLFSSRHVHYHGGEQADDKITELEERVEALEKAGK
jgi:hypothetical protein